MTLASITLLTPLYTLAAPDWLRSALFVLFLIACLLLMLTVLIQKPQGGGLAGAFGSGAGSGQTAFGTRTGDALTVATIGMFTLYLLTAIGLNYAARPDDMGLPKTKRTTPATTPATTTPAGTSAAPATAPKPTDAKPAEAKPATTETPAAPVEAPKPAAPAPVTPPATAPATPPATDPATTPPPAPAPK